MLDSCPVGVVEPIPIGIDLYWVTDPLLTFPASRYPPTTGEVVEDVALTVRELLTIATPPMETASAVAKMALFKLFFLIKSYLPLFTE